MPVVEEPLPILLATIEPTFRIPNKIYNGISKLIIYAQEAFIGIKHHR